MAIKKIKIKNFKSFDDVEIELGEFNVVIGANASGKSNFVSIFQFLKDAVKSGLEEAISNQGGIEYVRNIQLSSSKNLSVEITFDYKEKEKHPAIIPFFLELPEEAVKKSEVNWKFEIKFNDPKLFEVIKEVITYKFELCGSQNNVEVTISRDSEKIYFKKSPQEFKEKELPSRLKSMLERKMSKKALFNENVPFPFIPIPSEITNGLGIYKFVPELLKDIASLKTRGELSEDESNLSVVIRNILKDKENKKKFLNLVSDILPFVSNVKTEVIETGKKSLLVSIKEKYSKREYLPSFFISDGTADIMAIIVALFFEGKSVVIIEEPEKNIHPHLLSRIVEMMKDASKNTQIIVTTHSPEVIKYAGLENIILLSRNDEGFSKISRPGDKEEVKIFLKNNIGIDELYVQNLL